MNILIIGGGGREHALGWRFAASGHSVHSAPGNPGLAALGPTYSVDVGDHAAVAELAKANAIDLVVVGPEAPLVDGLADSLRAHDLAVFGPGAAGAQLEGSKSFSKRFFERHGVRTSPFVVCEGPEQARAAVRELGGAIVVKVDGLAAGKGVIVCRDTEAGLRAVDELTERFGDSAKTLVVERCVSGRELSVMAICDGKRALILAQAEDHKQLGDGNVGPNTGGMGTVSPAPWATAELLERIETEIFSPTLAGLAADNIDFRGVLYAGLMVDDDGVPWILEYNCRFGDPETQPLMVRLESDLGDALLRAARGDLGDLELEWDERTAVCVVVASAGYPASSQKGVLIEALSSAGERVDSDVVVFHAGTAMLEDKLVTAGGRVLGVTALGTTVEDARQRAYAEVKRVAFDGCQYRKDIGARK